MQRGNKNVFSVWRARARTGQALRFPAARRIPVDRQEQCHEYIPHKDCGVQRSLSVMIVKGVFTGAEPPPKLGKHRSTHTVAYV